MATLADWKPKLIGRMIVEGIKNFSDDEIKRVFSGCVSENLCIKYCHELIDAGLLTEFEVVSPFDKEEIKGLPYSVESRPVGFIVMRDSKDFWIAHFEAIKGIRQAFYQAYRAVEPVTGKKEAWAVNNKRLGSADHGFRTLTDAIEAIEKYREESKP